MKPELRIFLRPSCVINPPSEPAVKAGTEAVPLVGLFIPKLVDFALGGIASALKKAGDDETKQVSGSEFVSLFVADNQQRLSANPQIGCVLAVYGVFADVDKKPTPANDAALKALETAGIIPAGADITIVFEAAVVRAGDDTAFYLETRHFSVRDFIGDRGKSDRTYVATLTVATPDATDDGATIALGQLSLGRMAKETLPVPAGAPLGTYPRYRTNLMPWKMTADSKAAYDSDVKRGTAAGRTYMPVTFTLTLFETADGNKFLAALAELLGGAKGEAAKQLTALLDPEQRAKEAKADADAAEQLLSAEEDALIALRQAQAAAAAAPNDQVLQAKLAKASRAFDVAKRRRVAAGLAAPSN